jgi:hypothetical protein
LAATALAYNRERIDALFVLALIGTRARRLPFRSRDRAGRARVLDLRSTTIHGTHRLRIQSQFVDVEHDSTPES